MCMCIVGPFALNISAIPDPSLYHAISTYVCMLCSKILKRTNERKEEKKRQNLSAFSILRARERKRKILKCKWLQSMRSISNAINMVHHIQMYDTLYASISIRCLGVSVNLIVFFGRCPTDFRIFLSFFFWFCFVFGSFTLIRMQMSLTRKKKRDRKLKLF